MNSHSTGTLAKGSGAVQKPLRISRLTLCTNEVREDSSRGSNSAQAQILVVAHQRFNLPLCIPVYRPSDPCQIWNPTLFWTRLLQWRFNAVLGLCKIYIKT